MIELWRGARVLKLEIDREQNELIDIDEIWKFGCEGGDATPSLKSYKSEMDRQQILIFGSK